MADAEFLAQGTAFFPVSQRCREYFENRLYQADSDGWYELGITASELSAALREPASAPERELKMQVVVCVPGGLDSHVEVSGHTKKSPQRVETGETVYYELEEGQSITVRAPGPALPAKRQKSGAK